MEKNKIIIDKGTLAPEDFENTKLITLDDGSQEEVYISRAGNIVTDPRDRAKSSIDLERRQVCWDLYVKSLRTGKPSARQAAIDAGFSINTAINIRSMSWFKEKLKRLSRSSMGSKAERNLKRALDMDWAKMKVMDDGSEQEVIDKDIFREVIGVSKFIAGTLLKDEGYSTKTEVQGSMTGDIKINSISYADTPLEIENKVIDESIKLVEDAVIKQIDEEKTEN